MPISPELIDLSRAGCSDRIVGRESNRDWKFAHLDELWAGADVLRPGRPLRVFSVRRRAASAASAAAAARW